VIGTTLQTFSVASDLNQSLGGGWRGPQAGSTLVDPASLARSTATTLLSNQRVLEYVLPNSSPSQREDTGAIISAMGIAGAALENPYLGAIQSLPPIWEAGSLLYEAATFTPAQPRITVPNYLYNPDGSPRRNSDGTYRTPSEIPDFPELNMNPTTEGGGHAIDEKKRLGKSRAKPPAR
jgi:hypothetical protein